MDLNASLNWSKIGLIKEKIIQMETKYIIGKKGQKGLFSNSVVLQKIKAKEKKSVLSLHLLEMGKAKVVASLSKKQKSKLKAEGKVILVVDETQVGDGIVSLKDICSSIVYCRPFKN